jgi:hypothetical protein
MRKWLPAMLVGGILMGASAFWYHSRAYAPAQLLQMLPPDRGVYVFLDIGLLRSAGLLDVVAGAKSIEQPDYQKFVADTGFDYRQDLDQVAIAFRDGDVYYAAQGDFNWDKLAAYAPAHGGKCDRFLCTTPGSEPGRNVSYYMPRNNILALATSRTASAGDMVAPGTWRNGPNIPAVGLWVAAPGGVFKNLNAAPAVARPFLAPLAAAQSTIFTLGPGQQDFELRVEVTTRDAASSRKLAEQVESLNTAAQLTTARVESKDTQVVGTWPVSKAFLESLLK